MVSWSRHASGALPIRKPRDTSWYLIDRTLQLHGHFDGNVHGAGCCEHVHLVSADSTEMPKDTHRNEATIPRKGELKKKSFALEFFFLPWIFFDNHFTALFKRRMFYYWSTFIDRRVDYAAKRFEEAILYRIESNWQRSIKLHIELVRSMMIVS